MATTTEARAKLMEALSKYLPPTAHESVYSRLLIQFTGESDTPTISVEFALNQLRSDVAEFWADCYHVSWGVKYEEEYTTADLIQIICDNKFKFDGRNLGVWCAAGGEQ